MQQDGCYGEEGDEMLPDCQTTRGLDGLAGQGLTRASRSSPAWFIPKPRPRQSSLPLLSVSLQNSLSFSVSCAQQRQRLQYLPTLHAPPPATHTPVGSG